MVVLLSFCAASTQAADARGLTVDNFVAIGDAVSDMLAPSGLAFATMDLGSAAEPQARPLRARLRPTPPGPAGQTQQTACPAVM